MLDKCISGEKKGGGAGEGGGCGIKQTKKKKKKKSEPLSRANQKTIIIAIINIIASTDPFPPAATPAASSAE
jgi:hypothetical protein